MPGKTSYRLLCVDDDQDSAEMGNCSYNRTELKSRACNPSARPG
jgi:hypothetical protein